MTTSTAETGPVLVTGGTGKSGSRVASRLDALGVPVRLGSRRADPPFDWTDPTTWAAALDGVRAVYLAYQPDLSIPGAAETVAELAAAAVRAGAGRLVLLSGRGEPGAIAAEKRVLDVGAPTTIVRCGFFQQNVSEGFLLDAVLGGEIVLPAGAAVEPFVDLEDVADVAVAALTGEGHAGQVYELTGPRLLSFQDLASTISAAIGREVRYTPVPREAYVATLRELGRPVELAEIFDMFVDGRNANLTDGVRRALGREPRDFADFVAATAATDIWKVTP